MTKQKPFDQNLTEAQFKSRIVSVLRQLSRRWRPAAECIKGARVGRGSYKCEKCKTVGPATLPPKPGNKRRIKNILADHIEPIVDPAVGWQGYDEWVKRCFVGIEGFQALCKECHDKKTQEEKLIAKKRKQGMKK